MLMRRNLRSIILIITFFQFRHFLLVDLLPEAAGKEDQYKVCQREDFGSYNKSLRDLYLCILYYLCVTVLLNAMQEFI